MQEKKLIIVVHGSRAGGWRALQEQWFAGFLDHLTPRLREMLQPELTFLEINEPSFEDALKQAAPSVSELYVFPFFLSESGHAGEEIPEMIAEHVGSAKATIIRPAGWRDVLAFSSERRLLALGWQPELPVIVSGYGASHHDHLWQDLVSALRLAVAGEDSAPWHWAPSGHFLEDYHAPLRDAADAISAAGGRKAAILPLYLGISSYQEKLIPSLIEERPDIEWLFAPNAILPDPLVEAWAASLIADQFIEQSPEEHTA